MHHHCPYVLFPLFFFLFLSWFCEKYWVQKNIRRQVDHEQFRSAQLRGVSSSARRTSVELRSNWKKQYAPGCCLILFCALYCLPMSLHVCSACAVLDYPGACCCQTSWTSSETLVWQKAFTNRAALQYCTSWR